ncbi:MAG: 4-hydroxy-tetrahydrodipicolinate reductase [Elusimicrobia bacterium ADurb.Bin231]|nr:MAG: 4-hydroxy-tetrahydrodipicolinate reductase [Elusimicrobia bacterium ADurb.Bin231]
MIKVTVCGAAGKMGKLIIEKIMADKDTELSGATELAGHPAIGSKIGEVTITDSFTKAIENCDIAIDFTAPGSTLKNIESAVKSGKDLVIGTTGIEQQGIDTIQEAAKTIPIVFSPNMSVGINLLFKLVEEVSGILSSYDVEIVEAHHNQKKDAPSGTAAKLADIISKKLELNKVYGRYGMVGARGKEIGIHAVRAGDIIGEHTVTFAGPGERIELIHRAHSRNPLADGAVKAAKWLIGKKPGLYSMKDVLGL